jgi:hypothetical protein
MPRRSNPNWTDEQFLAHGYDTGCRDETGRIPIPWPTEEDLAWPISDNTEPIAWDPDEPPF